MSEKEIVHALKIYLKNAGITYKTLAQQINVSEPTLKRDFHRGSMPLARILKICDVLSVRLQEVLEFITTDLGQKVYRLTMEEEEYLARHLDVYAYIYLLTKYNTPEEVEKQLKLSKATTYYFLRSLERLGLIQILSKNKIRYLKGEHIIGNMHGAASKEIGKRVYNDFVSNDFSIEPKIRSLTSVELSPANVEWLRNRIQQLKNELIIRHNQDESLSHGKVSLGVLMAMRPWDSNVYFLELAKLLKSRDKRR